MQHRSNSRDEKKGSIIVSRNDKSRKCEKKRVNNGNARRKISAGIASSTQDQDDKGIP